ADLSGWVGVQSEVEHGMDERYAKVLFVGPGASQVRAEQADILHAVRVQRELRAALLARRSGARKDFVAAQEAGCDVATVCEPPAAGRVHVWAPGEEASVHGPGIRPAAGIQRSAQSRLALVAVRVAPRASDADSGLESNVCAGSRPT